MNAQCMRAVFKYSGSPASWNKELIWLAVLEFVMMYSSPKDLHAKQFTEFDGHKDEVNIKVGTLILKWKLCVKFKCYEFS